MDRYHPDAHRQRCRDYQRPLKANNLVRFQVAVRFHRLVAGRLVLSQQSRVRLSVEAQAGLVPAKYSNRLAVQDSVFSPHRAEFNSPLEYALIAHWYGRPVEAGKVLVQFQVEAHCGVV